MRRSRSHRMLLGLLVVWAWAVVAPDELSTAAGPTWRQGVPNDEARSGLVSDSTWRRILDGIEADRYAIRAASHAPGNAVYEAYNVVHRLRTTFAEDGVRVHPIESGEQAWGVRLEQIGCGDDLEPVVETAPVAVGNRVEYRRGALTEWYVNDPRGVEQGFTFAERPSNTTTAPGESTAAPAGNVERRRCPLVLQLHGAGLGATPEAASASILLAGVEGTAVLRYTGLRAWDARGTDLPAAMRATRDRIRIEIDDRGAVYPLTIDPFIERAVLRASDAQPTDRFGYRVSVYGNTVVVGAPEEDGGPGDLLPGAGAAYVFEGKLGGPNNFGEAKKLTASDAQAGDSFGDAVAISANWLIVGAPGEDGPLDSRPGAGAAYVFLRDQGGGGNWGEVRKLTASDADAGDSFGESVAIEGGDTAIVGASGEDGGIGDPLVDSGAAYIYRGTFGWGEVRKLTASNAQDGYRFGEAVAIAGDRVIVGASAGGGGMPPTFPGAAYVFERPRGGPNNWGEAKILTASDAQVGDRFGSSVAFARRTALVGAIGEAGGPGDPLPGAGAAYIFERDQGGMHNWGQVTKLTASDAQARDGFGEVAISGDTVIVGAGGEDGGAGDPLPGAGAAYVFERNQDGANAWGEVRKLEASDAEADDGFGLSVSVSMQTAIVGAPFEAGGAGDPAPEAGAAYIFEWSPWAFVLDKLGGLHAAGLDVVPIAPPPPYFGFDVARDAELSGAGAYVLDGFGGLHPAGGAPALSPPPPYFGFDVARDLELVSGGGGYVLDGFGGVHAAGGAPLLAPATPDFGIEVARDLELGGGGYYVLDGFGGVHAGGGATAISPAPPHFAFDIAKDLELATTGGGYELDGFGGVHALGGAPVLYPRTPYFGFDIARDLELAGGGYYVLDGLGGLHPGGGAAAVMPPPPHFGFDAARDLEIR